MKKVDISLLILVFALLVFVGVNILQDYGWKEKTVEMQTQIEELEIQLDQEAQAFDEKISDIYQTLNERYVQMEVGDDNLYYHCSLDGMIKVCDSVNYQEQINELQEQYAYEILYGTFVGLNAYVGIKTYHVILIDGVEYETLGDSNYTFIINEPCMVVVIGNTYHSIPLREEK